jgi:malonyl CoA-acyl carrier protein transacylase
LTFSAKKGILKQNRAEKYKPKGARDMARIDTHGVKIANLSWAAKATVNFKEFSGMNSEIFFDRATGEIHVFQHASYSSYAEIVDDDMIHVCRTDRHLTMQELANEVYRAVLWEELTELHEEDEDWNPCEEYEPFLRNFYKKFGKK